MGLIVFTTSMPLTGSLAPASIGIARACAMCVRDAVTAGQIMGFSCELTFQDEIRAVHRRRFSRLP